MIRPYLFALLCATALLATAPTRAQTQQDYDAARQRQQKLNQGVQQQDLLRQKSIEQNQQNWQQNQQFQQDLQTQQRLDNLEIQRRQQELDNPPPIVVVPAAPQPYYAYPPQGQPYGYVPPQQQQPQRPCRKFTPAYDQQGRLLGQVCVD